MKLSLFDQKIPHLKKNYEIEKEKGKHIPIETNIVHLPADHIYLLAAYL